MRGVGSASPPAERLDTDWRGSNTKIPSAPIVRQVSSGKACALAATNVPPLTTVPPLYVFVPLNVVVPPLTITVVLPPTGSLIGPPSAWLPEPERVNA